MRLLNSQTTLPWLLTLLWVVNFSMSKSEESQTYILHMDHSRKPESFSTHESWHKSTLNSLFPTQGEEMMLYPYNHVMHGFSARLKPSQLSLIEKLPAHRATYKESYGRLFTTHTTKFLGLNQGFGIWPASSFGEDVIVGIIDTGIWPESESFNDKGMPGIPQRWKGECENGTAFSPSFCNKKLIGARSFSKGIIAAGRNISTDYDFDSARDFHGHGTHTSSTAAGNHVLGVSHFGYARGTARGVAPRAHVAMYKVLWATDSSESAATDVLAGMDQAVADGVDVMSLSLGFPQTPYYEDVIAIASLAAIEKGITVVCAAGNDGGRNTTYNGAPWIMTVGAGTIDRSFVATMTLGNGLELEGTSYFPENVFIKNAPLYYGKDNVNKATCSHNALDHHEVRGRVVLCDNPTTTDVYEQIEELQRVRAYAGVVFFTDMSILDPDDYSIPVVVLPLNYSFVVKEYASGTNNPTVANMRFIITKLRTKPAPQVASFSSRGPDPINPSILKPDILAPGKDVLAAVAPNHPFMYIGEYALATDYELKSGTSMAAPHVAGVAALVRAVHRDWSPAAIRSAIMTTAYTLDSTRNFLGDELFVLNATPLDFGAGHVNPNKAMDPGLIYDLGFSDYMQFICGIGYTTKQMSAIFRGNQWACSSDPIDLNYPSFIAELTKRDVPMVKNFSRVVTNVGDHGSTYRAVVEVPLGMKIKVEPTFLKLNSKYEKQRFVMSVEIDEQAPEISFGFLKWVDQRNHIVSSPIVAIKG